MYNYHEGDKKPDKVIRKIHMSSILLTIINEMDPFNFLFFNPFNFLFDQLFKYYVNGIVWM